MSTEFPVILEQDRAGDAFGNIVRRLEANIEPASVLSKVAAELPWELRDQIIEEYDLEALQYWKNYYKKPWRFR